MIAKRSLFLLIPLTVLLFSGSSGCAGLRKQLAEKSPGVRRLERADEAARSFESRRSQAQFAAALEKAEGGNLAGCQEMLREIVARKPDFIEARLKLAELLWSDSDTTGAEAQLQAAVALAPDRADVHHALGVLLESLDRHEAALPHLARAAEIEPTNELYALSSVATVQR